MGKGVIFFVTDRGISALQIIQMAAMFVVMAVDTEVLPVAAVGGVVFVIVVLVVNRQFVHIPVRELPGATGAHPRVDLERLFTVAFFFLALILAGAGQKLIDLVGFAFSHGFFLPLFQKQKSDINHLIGQLHGRYDI